MRSHRRRQPLPHILLAGAAEELSAMAMVLRLLPDDAYGQVIVAGASALDADRLRDLPRPARVTVYAVPCLSEAVARWSEEWLPAEPDPQREVTAWLGSGVHDLDPALALCAERLPAPDTV